MKKILTTSILALAGVAFIVPAANAALSYTDGDLVVAFRGASQSYLIDLGQVSQFQTGHALADGNLHTLTIGNITTDLGGVGATVWSIQGSDPFGGSADLFSANSVWGSQVETTPGTPSVSLKNDNLGALSVPANNIQAMGTKYATGTAASNPAGNIQANSVVGSYRSWIAPGGASLTTGATYDYFTTAIEGSFTLGSNSSVLDVYQLDPNLDGLVPGNNAVRLGGFRVTSGGALQFSSDVTDFAPVPEPATFAFGFAMLGACVMGRFRTRRQSLEAATV